ncbi:MAG: hypothetical protein IJS19_01945, partial [Muribaculaceae bacterium]|nr:hypothetical protein [Muribaculaceae bacterium]
KSLFYLPFELVVYVAEHTTPYRLRLIRPRSRRFRFRRLYIRFGRSREFPLNGIPRLVLRPIPLRSPNVGMS